LFDTIIIGGGAGGLAAACFSQTHTLLLDQQKLGRKLAVGGNERVNLTNIASLNDFLNLHQSFVSSK